MDREPESSISILSLLSEILVEILKNLEFSNIISIRRICTELHAITLMWDLWQYIAQQVQQEEPGQSLLDCSKIYDQGVGRPSIEHNEELDKSTSHHYLPCFDLDSRLGNDVEFIGGRFCFAPEKGQNGGIWLVDMESNTPKIQRFCPIPIEGLRDIILEPGVLGYCIDKSTDSLAFLVAVSWRREDTGQLLLRIYTLISNNRNPNVQWDSDVVSQFLTGECLAVLMTERYILRIMDTADTVKVILNPRVQGEYSHVWASAEIFPGFVSAYIVPNNRLLIFSTRDFYIYYLFELIDLSLKSNPGEQPPSIEIYEQHIYLSFEFSLRGQRLDSYPHIGPTSTRIVLVYPDGLHGIEIPHDPTKLHRISFTIKFKADSKPTWVAAGISRSIIWYKDESLETVSHGLGLGKYPLKQLGVIKSPTLEPFHWEICGRFIEDIGRVVFRCPYLPNHFRIVDTYF